MVVIDHELKRETHKERDWHKRERERERERAMWNLHTRPHYLHPYIKKERDIGR